MDWIIEVPKAESARDALSPEIVESACRALRVHGVAILRGVFPSVLIDSLYKEFIAQFGAYDVAEMSARAEAQPPHAFLRVGGTRFDICPRMEGAFANPALFANPVLLDIFSVVLGGNVQLGGFTLVVSFPGTSAQHTHRDHPQLFEETGLGTVLPAYAINASVPLIDVDIETGPTAVWLGSHRWPEDRAGDPDSVTSVPFQRGDCLLLDNRTIHSGLANQSQRIRPVLYMAYARSWFFDEHNHKGRMALDMTLETYLGLSEDVRILLLRAYNQAMRSKQALRSD